VCHPGRPVWHGQPDGEGRKTAPGRAARPAAPGPAGGHGPGPAAASDGKSARGSGTDAIPWCTCSPPSPTPGRPTVTQLCVPDKANETVCFAPLLGPFNLQCVIVTADALHPRRAPARLPVEQRKANYLLVIKANQRARPSGCARCHGRRWPSAATTASAGTAGARPARSGCRPLRRWAWTSRTPCRPLASCATAPISSLAGSGRQIVYVLTGLAARQASPQRIGQLTRSSC
jgi:hypothetical protein